MGKGQIISSTGEGLYQLRLVLDQKRVTKRIEALDTEITQLDTQITAQRAETERLLAKLKTDTLNVSYRVEYGTAKSALNLLVARQTSARKNREYLQTNMPDDPETDAWCADLTDDLTGDVGTVEVPGERGRVQIVPGFAGDAAYQASRDGILQPAINGTPANVFFNWSILPGWQKWQPTYRYGVITAIDGDFCNIDLDQASSSAQGLNINQTETLSSVPIVYMECNGAAFSAGDHVLIRFESQDWSQPQVIGFYQEPQGCGFYVRIIVDGIPAGADAAVTMEDTTGARLTANETDQYGYAGPFIGGDTLYPVYKNLCVNDTNVFLMPETTVERDGRTWPCYIVQYWVNYVYLYIRYDAYPEYTYGLIWNTVTNQIVDDIGSDTATGGVYFCDTSTPDVNGDPIPHSTSHADFFEATESVGLIENLYKRGGVGMAGFVMGEAHCRECNIEAQSCCPCQSTGGDGGYCTVTEETITFTVEGYGSYKDRHFYEKRVTCADPFWDGYGICVCRERTMQYCSRLCNVWANPNEGSDRGLVGSDAFIDGSYYVESVEYEMDYDTSGVSCDFTGAADTACPNAYPEEGFHRDTITVETEWGIVGSWKIQRDYKNSDGSINPVTDVTDSGYGFNCAAKGRGPKCDFSVFCCATENTSFDTGSPYALKSRGLASVTAHASCDYRASGGYGPKRNRNVALEEAVERLATTVFEDDNINDVFSYGLDYDRADNHWLANVVRHTAKGAFLRSDIRQAKDYITDEQAEFLSIINAYRNTLGLQNLTWNYNLNQAALRHIEDISVNLNIEHTGADGSDPIQRIWEAGYMSKNESHWEAYENLARFPVGSTPQDVFEGWLGSPPHKATIEGVFFTEMGFKTADGSDGYRYYCNTFGFNSDH